MNDVIKKPLGANTIPHRIFRTPYGVTERYARRALDAGGVIETSDGSVTAQYSALDTFWVPRNESNETLLFWVSRMLQLSEQEYHALTAESITPEAKKLYDKISGALALAHRVSANTFLYELNHLPDKIATRDKLIALLRQTSRFQEDIRKAPLSIDTCYLLGLAVAANEALSRDASAYEAEGAYIQNTLFNGVNLLGEKLLEKRKKKGEYMLETDAVDAEMFFSRGAQELLYATGTPIVSRTLVQVEGRGKREERVVAKIGRVPNLRSKDVVKDAIGIRLTVTPEHAPAIISGLLDHIFSPPLSASAVRIENDGFNSSVQEAETLRTTLSDTYGRNVTFQKATPNANSGGFATLKILGTVRVPRGGIGEIVERPIEIQLVPLGHSNEIRERHHAIYDLAQELELFTRLRVVCPEEIFAKLVDRAAKKTGFSNETVVEYLERRGALAMLTSRQKDKHYYVHPGVYKRLAHFPGLVAEDLLEQVTHEAAKKGQRSAAIAERLRKRKLQNRPK